MSMLSTTFIPPKLFVSPCTSMTSGAASAGRSAGEGKAPCIRLMAASFCLGRYQRYGDRLAGTKGFRLRIGRCLGHEDELLFQAVAIDDGRRELGFRGNEPDGVLGVWRAVAASEPHLCAMAKVGEFSFRHKETHLDVAGRQQRD